MPPIIDQLKQRKLVRWALAYLAGAGVVYSTLDGPLRLWGVTDDQLKVVQVLLVVGFLVAVTLAWYHGERGHQRVSGGEVAILATILVVGLAGLRLVSGQGETAVAPSASASEAAGGLPVIAVMPFDGSGQDGDGEFFTSGMHLEVLTRLSSIAGVRVLALRAVASYAGSAEDSRDIADAIGADWLIFGQVRRSEADLSLAVQLVDPETDSNHWADTYQRDLSAAGVFGLQEDIARQVAVALQVVLTPEEDERLAARPTQNMEAYDLYLRGMEFYQNRGNEDNDAAIRLFREALEMDGEYAEAWAGLGDAFAQRACCLEGYDREWADSAASYASRAISLNPNLAVAHKALGQAYATQERLGESVASYRTAMRLDPSHAAAANNLGLELRNQGRYDDGHRWVLRAVRVLPNHPTILQHLVNSFRALSLEEQAREALIRVADRPGDENSQLLMALHWGDPTEVLRRAEEIASGTDLGPRGARNAAMAMYLMGEAGRAVALATHAVENGPVPNNRTAWHYADTVLGLSLLGVGRVGEGEQVLLAVISDHEARLRDGSQNWRSAWAVATANAGLGRYAEAQERLQQAYDLGFRELQLLELEPSWASLRDDARFEAIRSRIAADLAGMRANVLEDLS
ncbi:MAG: tetratricopeptide repeat protein [Longimicrobiales bacterium]